MNVNEEIPYIRSKYRLKFLRVLGEGAHGKVSLYQKPNNDVVVVKLVPFDQDNSEYAYETVQKELEVFSKIRHPRIIEYLGFFHTHLGWNFLMEFASGGTLRHYLTQRADARVYMRGDRVVSKFLDIAFGLHILHSNKIMHRDLKPENILIDGRNNRLKLADFGIAKIFDPHTDVEEDLNMTIIGSLNYMAPELKRRNKYNIKCDIWSLGIVFYELCRLRHPFSEYDVTHIPRTTPRIDCHTYGYPTYFEDLNRMMIQIQPNRRHSVKDLLSLPQFADSVHKLYLGN